MQQKPGPPGPESLLLLEQRLETLRGDQALAEAHELELQLEATRREQGKLIRKFVHEHSANLRKLADRLVGRNEGQDVAQEAFERLARRIRAKPLPEVMTLLGSSEDLLRLMYRITACRAYEHLRRKQNEQGKQAEITLDDDVESEFKDVVIPHLDTGIEIERLERAYERLSPAQRVAHVLHHYHGFTDAEIAATLRLTKTNSRTLVHRAQRALQCELGVKQ